MSDDFLKLRVIEAYPERWLKILPALPNESELEYKLRVMNISVPWTNYRTFRKFYLDQRDPFQGLIIPRLMKPILKFMVQEDSVKFLLTYGKQYVLEFYNSFVENFSKSIFGRGEWRVLYKKYIPLLARALYRYDRNFYQTLNVPDIHREYVIDGILIECVYADDEETFDIVMDKKYPIRHLNSIANASERTKNTKFVRKIIQYIYDEEIASGKSIQEISRVTLISLLRGRFQILSFALNSISEISGIQLKDLFVDLFEFISKNEILTGYEIVNGSQAFYFAGLNMSDIIQVVTKIGRQNKKHFQRWLKTEDV